MLWEQTCKQCTALFSSIKPKMFCKRKCNRRWHYLKSRTKEINRAKQWRLDNPQKYKNRTRNNRVAESASYKAAKINAVPKWANRKTITTIYKAAKQQTKITGIKITVDHIVPLRHPLVCGLHCIDNLQLLFEKDNLSKGNRFWPHMP